MGGAGRLDLGLGRGQTRLGGWYDTKRTGRIGWQTLWHGWELFHLTHRLTHT